MKTLILLMIVVYASLPGLTSAQASPVFDEAIAVTIQVGTNTDELVFIPNELSFQSGKLYKLMAHNPSSLTHNLMVDQLGKAGLTTNVEMIKTDPAIQAKSTVESEMAFPHKVQAIKIKPGETAVWYLMPITEGRYSFKCGNTMHSSAGMKGTIAVN